MSSTGVHCSCRVTPSICLPMDTDCVPYHLVLVNSAYCNIQVSRIFGLGVQALSLSGPRDPADLAICRLSEYKQLRLRGHLFPNVWALLPQPCINQLSQYEPR